MAITRILWHSLYFGSAEHLHLQARPGGHRLTGTVVLPIDGRPALIRYLVEVDEQWSCRTTELEIDGSSLQRHMRLETDRGGRWAVDGEPRPELDGCTDVDLGFTPATNTLPIRRLGLAVGERADLRAALVEFPDLAVVVSEQTYERADTVNWRFSAGAFSADLEVDPASGIVLNYRDLWAVRAYG